MKLKGINPFEQHVEQIVLVTVSGVFLLVVAAQFLVEPNRVKVGTGQPVSPGKAFLEAEGKAQQLKSRMESTATPEVQVPDVNLADQFRSRLTAPVAPAQTLASAIGPSMQLQAAGDLASSGQAQALSPVAIPAPTQALARAFRSTVDPTEPLNNPDLKAYLPPEQPMDKAAVSVEARFDGTALKAAFQEAAGGKAMPDIWWSNERTAILGVRLEREEQTPTGEWTNLTEVPPVPGRVDGVKIAQRAAAQMDMADAVAELRGYESDIVRPSYFRVIAGEPWQAPADAPAQVVVDPAVAPLVRQVKDAQRRVDALQKQLDGGESRPAPRQPTGGGGGGKGGASKGGGGGGAQAPQADPQADPQRRRLEADIARYTKQRDEAIEKLRVLGYDGAGAKLQQQPENTAPETTTDGRNRTIFADPAIRVWSHDLAAEPGKTYRYRVKLAINNPAFGRSAALVPEQQDLAKQHALWSQASEWSEPVMVPADRYYFITSATEAGPLGAARAQAEVYQFFYGYYRKGTVGLEPGDPLTVQVALPKDANTLPIFDLTKPIAEGAAQPANTPTATPQPAPSRGGGKGGLVGGGGGPAAAPTAQPEAAQVTLPENATPWTKPIIASEDVFLLDVARVPGPETLMQAVLRGRDGTVVTRIPDESSDTYKMVETSAKAGELQGRPAAPEPEPARPLPGQTPDAPRDRTPSGGGGGGGSS